MVIIQIYWEENEIRLENKTISKCYKEAFIELKKRDVLTVGLSESLTQGIQNLYLFLWTPVLLASTPGEINVGFIFLCMVASIVCGSKIYEVCAIYLKLNYYYMLASCLFGIVLAFIGIFTINSFLLRVCLFTFLNGTSGLYSPTFSIIKYKVLEDKHRALLMNIFRIPLNIYIIVVLLLLKYIDPFEVKF